MRRDYDRTYGEHLYENRIIYLSGDISTSTAELVVGRLLVLESLDKEAEIKVYISSYGGAVYPGLAIYDAIQMIEAPVSTFCVGPAFSMAAVLLAAGEPGRRMATPNSRVMIHQPSSGFLGTSTDIKIAAQNVLQIEAQIIEILSRHTGRTDEEISVAIERDFWLTPDEAIDFGLIDAVAQPCTRKLMRARAFAIRDEA